MNMNSATGCLPDEAAREAPSSGGAPAKTQTPERARRSYLTQRRHELLGLVNALHELASYLVEDEKICACDRALGNLDRDP